MNNTKAFVLSLKYLFGFTIPIALWISFSNTAWLCWFPIIYAFGIIPLAELILPEVKWNDQFQTQSLWYDLYIFLLALANLAALYYYFVYCSTIKDSLSDYLGRSISMGISGGAIGINLAHEFGHRKQKIWKAYAHFLLMTNHYLHFYLEHNYGHHKLAATAEDPATARFGESVYAFWKRCIPSSFKSAFRIADKMNDGKSWYYHRMLQYFVIQILFDLLIYYYFGLWALIGLLISSVVGILLLETVNYVEHYGLKRNKINDNMYEPFREVHAWNSDHIIGRTVLFELTRHADHHLNTTKHYQYLNSIGTSPQLPLGYPGSMVLSLFPGLWKKIIHPIIENLKN